MITEWGVVKGLLGRGVIRRRVVVITGRDVITEWGVITGRSVITEGGVITGWGVITGRDVIIT